ncbi:Gamma-glutamyltranspeptidase 1 [Neolecta irregularis DAH-3]|uniref:Glutathione hydrolase n=1 Tax=Neolecta irregularis (strain DAH-3) TaxID=1198029 RepID=A0A1U7LVE3_NEOID|nr:Gamma-glutamyltranspeptidase 1 [Neolecta irregularis DAH-3]|eukprot:OLL26645.1 Gamma-glutamyltranspeptidase 1 [Neolecta irregularis DAH-3]
MLYKTPRNAAGLAIFFLLAVLAFLLILPHPHRKPSTLVQGRRGAVASDIPACSTVGINILKSGGNAVDSAIAAALCVGTINMFSSGIGGGGFMLIRHQNGSASTINFRETAPARSQLSDYVHDPLRLVFGPLSIGTPGEIAGFSQAHALYGALDWADLFQPSIALSRDGFPASFLLQEHLQIMDSLTNFSSHPSWAPMLAPGGSLLKEGDIVRRLNYSNTLQAIAQGGPSTFYTGDIARSITSYIQEKGGVLTEGDLANYTAKVESPIRGWYRGRDVITCGPPCSGPALLEGLNILEGFDMGKPTKMTHKGLHRLVEVMKWLSAGRTELGDPIDETTANRDRVEEIKSKEWAAKVRANISDHKTYGVHHYRPSYQMIENHGTTHLNVVDSQGMAVSLTTTINQIFGSLVCDPVTGIIFNDQLDDFSLPGHPNAFNLRPSPFNFLKPFKRPLSSAAPTIITHNNELEFVLGASGGSRIVTSVLDAIIKLYDWKMNLFDVIDSPRVHHQLLPMEISIENNMDASAIASLKGKGHEVRLYPRTSPLSDVQAILRLKSGLLQAVSDARKYGLAAVWD